MARYSDGGREPSPALHVPSPAGGPQRHGRWIAAAAGGAAAVLVLAFCMPFVLPGVLTGARGTLPWFPPPSCARTTVVEVVAAPLVQPAVTALTARLEGTRLSDDSCLSVRVREQDPADTVASSAVLPASRAPQLWVSDSSLWLARLTRWEQHTAGSFGTSPVIVVSSGAASRAPANRAWTSASPGWAEVFQSARPLSVPDVAGSATAQLSMIALWQVTGKGASADRAVAAATMAARGTAYASEGDALSAIVNPADGQTDAGAPFVVTTEASMLAINRDSMREVLTPLYPRGGSPFLDYPIVRLAGELQDGPHQAGTDLAVAALTSAGAQAAAHQLGLRDSREGNLPGDQRGLPAAVRPLAPPSAADLTRVLTRLAALAIPSRLLVTMDVSLSMRTLLPGTGLTRLESAARAAAALSTVLPDASSVGLWVHALSMDGTKPYRELSPVAPLRAAESGVTHREVVTRKLLSLDQQLTGGGTGLYVTALAAIRSLRARYDPRASNSVILFTDGTNLNDPRLSLQQLLTTLRQEAAGSPGKPVRIVCIGLGPRIDFRALEAIADATGGSAYQAQTGAALQTALGDAISPRA